MLQRPHLDSETLSSSLYFKPQRQGSPGRRGLGTLIKSTIWLPPKNNNTFETKVMHNFNLLLWKFPSHLVSHSSDKLMVCHTATPALAIPFLLTNYIIIPKYIASCKVCNCSLQLLLPVHIRGSSTYMHWAIPMLCTCRSLVSCHACSYAWGALCGTHKHAKPHLYSVPIPL